MHKAFKKGQNKVNAYGVFAQAFISEYSTKNRRRYPGGLPAAINDPVLRERWEALTAEEKEEWKSKARDEKRRTRDEIVAKFSKGSVSSESVNERSENQGEASAGINSNAEQALIPEEDEDEEWMTARTGETELLPDATYRPEMALNQSVVAEPANKNQGTTGAARGNSSGGIETAWIPEDEEEWTVIAEKKASGEAAEMKRLPDTTYRSEMAPKQSVVAEAANKQQETIEAARGNSSGGINTGIPEPRGDELQYVTELYCQPDQDTTEVQACDLPQQEAYPQELDQEAASGLPQEEHIQQEYYQRQAGDDQQEYVQCQVGNGQEIDQQTGNIPVVYEPVQRMQQAQPQGQHGNRIIPVTASAAAYEPQPMVQQDVDLALACPDNIGWTPEFRELYEAQLRMPYGSRGIGRGLHLLPWMDALHQTVRALLGD